MTCVREGECCATSKQDGMSLKKMAKGCKLESRSNRGLFLDLYLRTVSAGSRTRPDDLEPWHRSVNRLNGHNAIPQYHTTNEQDSKSQKKDKPKWSLGGFFRRRKKDDSDSSSDDEDKKGFLSRKSRSKRQTNPTRLATGFDHVVVPQIQSDHSGGSFLDARGSSKESLVSGTGSLERHKRRKERVKARAEALRDRLKHESSSDEDETSPGSSSISRFRSDDSLHGSLPRRGRRFRKLPKDDEVPGLRNSYSSGAIVSKIRDDGVMHVQLPLGVHSKITKGPPAPPPRDHTRKYFNANHDASRPLSYAFETQDNRNAHRRSQSSSRLAPVPSERCNSEDHIALNEQYRPNYMPDRPSSVTTEVIRPQVKRFITRHPSENDVVDSSTIGRYKYFADQTPRSRKPILATPFVDNYDSVAKMYRPPPLNKECKSVRSASDFWRMKDQEETARRMKKDFENNKIKYMVRDVPLKPDPPVYKCTVEVKKREPPVPPQRKYTPNRTSSGSSNGDWNDVCPRPKSANLEDALSELEAIYKSLKLSDEDLLDRAERLDVTTQVDKKPVLRRRSTIPDKITDDMAYRRLHPKDRQLTQECVSPQISYLSSSPLASRTFEYNTPTQNGNEPDVTLDDVVYRNVRHANHSLKVKEPQPPFGIPLGPVVPGANSDYLHAAPKNTFRLRFMPRKSPDVVIDDLAYRNLRKDVNKNSALPPIKPINDDMHYTLNNNSSLNNNIRKQDELATAKKKRAVRSMSANVYSLLHQHMQSLIDDDEQDFGKVQSLSDVNYFNRAQSRTLPVGAKLQDRNLSKSPTSTETLISSQNDINTRKVEDEYLTTLAQKAKEATAKIDQELKELRKDSVPETNKMQKSPTVSEILRELELVSEQAQKCENNLRTSIDNQSEPRTYTLVPSVDSGHTTEDSDVEQQVDVVDNSENLVYTSVASLLDQTSKQDESKFKDLSDKCQMQLGNLQQDYDNVPSTVLELGQIVTENDESPKYTAAIGSEMKRKKSLMKTEGAEKCADVQRRLEDINANETKINEITNSIQNNILSISEILKSCQDDVKVEPPKSSDDDDTPDYANIPPKTNNLQIETDEEETSEYNSAEELAMIFGKDGSKSKSSTPPGKSPVGCTKNSTPKSFKKSDSSSSDTKSKKL
ncbi:uncharacterized protein LOC113363191 isoform X1 [Ctenocephalides felis]|uniref:uncharacterized protein LOC113363191 isoform X1 n=1 Tax=Ctenocephalides felis TaxID=7515 RepID=UPI000E6E4B62|nr:uncharacterized protein LOC113363191 isoform X1 [Ctenocephalides felis]